MERFGKYVPITVTRSIYLTLLQSSVLIVDIIGLLWVSQPHLRKEVHKSLATWTPTSALLIEQPWRGPRSGRWYPVPVWLNFRGSFSLLVSISFPSSSSFSILFLFHSVSSADDFFLLWLLRFLKTLFLTWSWRLCVQRSKSCGLNWLKAGNWSRLSSFQPTDLFMNIQPGYTIIPWSFSCERPRVLWSESCGNKLGLRDSKICRDKGSAVKCSQLGPLPLFSMCMLYAVYYSVWHSISLYDIALLNCFASPMFPSSLHFCSVVHWVSQPEVNPVNRGCTMLQIFNHSCKPWM